MRDLARKFATETKGSWSQFDPAPDRVLGRDVVKGRIDFDGGEIAGIKLEPFGLGQFRGIKTSAPFRETPGAGANPNFLLIGKVQTQRKSKLNRNAREDVDLPICKAESVAVSGVAQLDAMDNSI